MSYDYTVTYTAGSQLVIADALSRIRLDPDGRSKSASDTLVGELVAALPMSESRRANLQVACTFRYQLRHIITILTTTNY